MAFKINGNLVKHGRNLFWVIAAIVIVSNTITLIAGIPRRVEANEVKNVEQDELNAEQNAALAALVKSLGQYAEAQEMRNGHDLEMRKLLIEMIGKNTERIDHIKEG